MVKKRNKILLNMEKLMLGSRDTLIPTPKSRPGVDFGVIYKRVLTVSRVTIFVQKWHMCMVVCKRH